MNFNAQVTVNTARIGFLFSMLAKQIVNSAGKRLDNLNKMMPKSDSKERDKIRAKKLAHGQKDLIDKYNHELKFLLWGLCFAFVAYLVVKGVRSARASKKDTSSDNSETPAE